MRRIPLGALREREFRLFFTGQLVPLLGDAVTPFALAWAVLDLTGSARDLGFVIAAKTAPLVVFLLANGVFADRLLCEGPHSRYGVAQLERDALRLTSNGHGRDVPSGGCAGSPAESELTWGSVGLPGVTSPGPEGLRDFVW